MDKTQIFYTLINVRSFLGVFTSDLLLHSIAQTCTVTINADPHMEKDSHWLAVQFRPRSSSAYYFNYYDILPLVPDIQGFIRRKSSVSDFNQRQLQGLTINVCGKYCCLFALYTDLGYKPK